MDFSPGVHVWVASETDVAVPAEVVDGFSPGDEGKVRTPAGEEIMLTTEQTAALEPMDEQTLTAVEDLITLNELNEFSVLHQLRMRFGTELVCTQVSAIVVVINPFKWLPMFSEEVLAEYMKSRKPSELPPHIWCAAKGAYEGMVRTGQAQSLLVAGESGAGKTEATKIILNYLAKASRLKDSGAVEVSTDGAPTVGLETKLLQSNPILEAFGNAKTVRNNNSSRFGKLFTIFFDPAGAIGSASVTNYLLEKSRVVHQTVAERNYHIYYQLLGTARANAAGAVPADVAAHIASTPVGDPAAKSYLQGAVTDNDLKEFGETIQVPYPTE
jgi:myosin heavy subunit